MRSVLIVDDTQSIAKLIQSILSADPMIKVVGIAQNGKEAIEMSQKLNPDVITMDLYMPEMDGIEAMSKILATQARPVIIISSSSDEYNADAGRAKTAGAYAVLGKPPAVTSTAFADYSGALIETVKKAA